MAEEHQSNKNNKPFPTKYEAMYMYIIILVYVNGREAEKYNPCSPTAFVLRIAEHTGFTFTQIFMKVIACTLACQDMKI